MKFLIIIPVHNEEKCVLYGLRSLWNQTHQDFKIVIVNDGSTDTTPTIIEEFITENNASGKISMIHLPSSTHEPGAKVVRTFNRGLESVDKENFDIICKFDADIIFPPTYLEEIDKVYTTQPKAGMVSGIVKIKNKPLDLNFTDDFSNQDGAWQFEDISSKNHVRGPIKSYRKKCFEDMHGLRPVLGWDNIDSLLAEKNGWEIITLKNLWVKHLRPTAYQYQHQKFEKLGLYFYNIGLDFSLAIISALKASWKSKSIGGFFTIMKAYLKQNHPLSLTEEEINYIRTSRKQKIKSKFF